VRQSPDDSYQQMMTKYIKQTSKQSIWRTWTSICAKRRPKSRSPS